MVAWSLTRTDEQPTLAIAISSFYHEHPLAVSFKLGDRLEIKEECEGVPFKRISISQLYNMLLIYLFWKRMVQRISGEKTGENGHFSEIICENIQPESASAQRSTGL
jgi:hypothetical protein